MISNDVALHCFSSICSLFIGLCVLGKVIGVLSLEAFPRSRTQTHHVDLTGR